MSRDASEALRAKLQFFEDFWRGCGPYPIIFAEPHRTKGRAYLKHDLVEQHCSIEKHLQERLLGVQPHLELSDDGIPTLRSDLGTTLLPGGLGLAIEVQEELQPRLAGHLTAEELLRLPEPLRAEDLLHGEVEFPRRFYRRLFDWRSRGRIPKTVLAYVPETEGVFHLLFMIRALVVISVIPRTVLWIPRLAGYGG